MTHGVHIPFKMNSLNIITARVSPSSSAAPSRTNSLGSLGLAVTSEDDHHRSLREAPSPDRTGDGTTEEGLARSVSADGRSSAAATAHDDHGMTSLATEETPLLGSDTKEVGVRTGASSGSWHLVPKRVATTLINSLRWVLSTLVSPGVYLIACFYDENGNFAPLLQLKRLLGFHGRSARKLAVESRNESAEGLLDEKAGSVGHTSPGYGSVSAAAMAPTPSLASSSSAVSSESESDGEQRRKSSRHTRSTSLGDSEEIAPARRSIRIKLHNEDALRQRKRRSQAGRPKSTADLDTPDISAQLKSPTSPVGALTKYPKTPAPPRPLIPRRQPSYLNLVESVMPSHQKTLILDLDETLIHSMSKGGRMSTGHMVEVRLNTAYTAVGGQTLIGPQHPILYYVHKRPFCDDFLRRVCKWYNLVVFTASVQEYADPVIDWLEQERKFFSARYYRQHCTFRQGAFIKDLSSVEPDLSKVMILDNSPLSYMFQQDNAIPIHGWTNDPTDKHLLHLVPLLEGLQYVSDVRAFLALRGGEDGQHMA